MQKLFARKDDFCFNVATKQRCKWAAACAFRGHSLLDVELETQCGQCQKERALFRREGALSSPACAQLFRNAVLGNREAWAALHRVLWPECLAWFEHWTRSYSWMSADELAQDVWLKLQTQPPTQPTQGDDISPAMAYLRTCAMRRFLMERRKDKHRIAAGEISLDQTAPNSNSAVAYGETLAVEGADGDFADEVDLRLSVQRLINDLFDECQRHIVFEVFVLKKPRADVVKSHPECFESVNQVFEATRTIRNTLATHPDFQELAGRSGKTDKKRSSPHKSAPVLASLIVGKPGDEADPPMNNTTPCDVGEHDLFDYVLGHALPVFIHKIEASPACVAAAQLLAEQLAQWQPILRHATCPDVDTLVDFFEQHLAAGPRLAVGRHIQECLHCQDELAQLSEMSGVFAPQPEPALLNTVKRVLRAIFIGETQRANALRGQLVQFQTDTLIITLDRQRAEGKALRWVLSGEVRSLQGQPITTLKRIEIARKDTTQNRMDILPADVEVIGEDGMFFINDLEPGEYKLRLDLDDVDIELDRNLVIGDTFTVP